MIQRQAFAYWFKYSFLGKISMSFKSRMHIVCKTVHLHDRLVCFLFKKMGGGCYKMYWAMW